jgi:hypothetical protein
VGTLKLCRDDVGEIPIVDDPNCESMVRALARDGAERFGNDCEEHHATVSARERLKFVAAKSIITERL